MENVSRSNSVKPFYKQMGEGFHSARLTIHVLLAHESFSIYCFGCFLDTGLEISLPKPTR